MEIFGLLSGFLFAFVLCLFVPALIYKFLDKNRFSRLAIVLLSGVFVISMVIEIVLISRFGLVTAHDKFHPLLDQMQGYNTIFGPLALTSLSVIWLRNVKSKLKVVKWCAGFVCFCAFSGSLIANLFYDADAHYRTDSEGTYRIEEKK